MKILLSILSTGLLLSSAASLTYANCVGKSTCYQQNLGVGGKIYQNGHQVGEVKTSAGSPSGMRTHIYTDHRPKSYHNSNTSQRIPEYKRQHLNNDTYGY